MVIHVDDLGIAADVTRLRERDWQEHQTSRPAHWVSRPVSFFSWMR